ncbi:MAG: hypothetical protein HOQ22_03995 [Nocardioidaceae bacterium]|nr:hypothetical protein [Nocardioidaceae bacterium]
MIVTYVGRRAHSLPANLGQVSERIARLLGALRPTYLVGSAADGADLLVLEAALSSTGTPGLHVILPTSRADFAEGSVEAAWHDRFDAVVDEVERRGGAVRSLERSAGDRAYRDANQAMLDAAQALAAEAERNVLLVLAREGEGEYIEDMQARARLRGVPVLRIDPSVDMSTRPRCFIAMPFGRKPDPQRRIDVDCDLVYAKVLVPALENAQLNYRRGDEEIDSGLVLEPMIDALANADIVVGDLGTGNFNVGWELGLRHLLRPRQTVLIRPAGTTAPFDLAALRHARYVQDQTGITDGAAIDAWHDLAQYLCRDGTAGPNDSPVAAAMDVKRWAEVRRRNRRDARWEELRQRLALARDLRDADMIREVLADADALSDDHQRLVRAEAGVGLVRLGRFHEARPLLREIVDTDRPVQRPDAHVYFAQSLYRPDGASLADLDRAEAVLEHVLLRRPAHPQVRALLGAVAKRRLRMIDDPDLVAAGLRAALGHYRHDVERNLNLYYEGVNVVALGTALAVRYADTSAGQLARDLLPAVQVAARLASRGSDDRFWALVSLAECTLHEHLLDGVPDQRAVHAAYATAAAERPVEGELTSALQQLDLLEYLGLPAVPIRSARAGLRGDSWHR